MPISQFTRIARSGKTTDGRELTQDQIRQMAASYDRKKFGARVNLEHYMSFFPNSDFRAYGDVIALKAEKDGNEMVLLAQIDATDDLVKLSATRQKIYWSIEMHTNFAGTGQAYLTGLAATDIPASLGTEIIKFVAASDKAPKDKFYSESVEGSLELEEPTKSEGPNLLEKVKQMFGAKGKGDEARFQQMEEALTLTAETVSALKASQPKADAFASADALKALTEQVTALTKQLDGLTEKLSSTEAKPGRQPVSGTPANQTDC
ncbi:MAG: GPO family capsid scaffolding protein [Alphaproteobacteria bacterium]|nr:GPO family capsid scaffolding protein [Alphaproteobacteria bacterium]